MKKNISFWVCFSEYTIRKKCNPNEQVCIMFNLHGKPCEDVKFYEVI